MTASPKWYNSTGSTELTAEQTLDGLAGTASTPLEVQVINNKNGVGASDLINARLRALFRDPGETEFVGAIDEWADRHYLEIRIETGGWNTSFAQSEWVRVGADATFELPVLANDEGVKLAIRLNAPVDAQADTKEFTLRIEQSFGEATSVGLSEATKQGIYLELNDKRGTTLLQSGGNSVENPGGQDQNVQIQDSVWVSLGNVYAELQQLLNHPVAASGKVRYDLAHLNSSGSLTRLAGSEIDPPLTEADKPAVPYGAVGLYYVSIDDAGPISNAKITDIRQLGGYGFSSSGLTVTLGPGKAVIGNSRITSQGEIQVVLSASSTSYIWLNRAGNLDVTSDLTPVGNWPILLYKVTTDGSGVTDTVDLRSWTGIRPQIITFEWLGEATVDFSVGDYRYAQLHSNFGGQIYPLLPIVAAIGTQVTGSGLSGSTKFVVEVERSGSWVDLFVSNASEPEIAYDATDLRSTAAIPETYDIPANARIRAKVDAVPSGTVTTNPTYPTLSLFIAS